ncbi:MAG: alpha/beta hydrolase [Geminicoccaceae bacterium]
MNDIQNSPYLDPETAKILAEMAEAVLPDRTSLSVAEAREQMEAGNKVWNTPLPDMADARDFEIEGPAGGIPMRLLRPLEATSEGAIVYLHGGGWVLGSLESHHRVMRLLAIESGAAVIGVDYRRSPEHPFPGPLEDGLAAARWFQKNAASLDLNAEKLVLAGDSAGANLALACLLELRDRGEAQPIGAALFYGCYWAKLGTESHRQFGDGGYRLSTKEMAWFWKQYLGDHGKGNPLAEPMDANLGGLPPLFLNYGTIDPLADDTKEMVERLDRAGVVHECIAYPGLVHGFLQMTNRVPAAAAAMADAGRAIQDMLR